MDQSPLLLDTLTLLKKKREVRPRSLGIGLTAGLPRLLLLLFCLSLLGFYGTGAAAADIPHKIGVLAIRGKEQCLKSWSATADYLSKSIPGHNFVIIPLSHTEINASVEKGEVDFILTNSSSYVELEHLYGANRIATLKERRLGGVYSKYGSVIFCRSDRKDIRKLVDLKGKRFMAVSETSLGGWQMTWRELRENGIEPYKDFKELVFGETHDAVVTAVQSGFVDAGTVRTNTLEQLSAEGKINLKDFYAFSRLQGKGQQTPYLLTTREYPDWPMAKVMHTSDELAEKVAITLLQMQPDSPAARAAECAGWTIPLNYQPVDDLMRALRLGHYKDLGKITFRDVLRTYGVLITLVCIVFTMLVLFTGLVLKLNRRIKATHFSLTEEIQQHKKLDVELQKAKDLAVAATRAKSEFLANMSHEIRTPMNGIIAATDLALGEVVPPTVEQYLHIVQNSSYALLGIINDILDFSKIEAGQLELKERIFRLDEMFDRVMDVFIYQAGEKGIELLVDIDRDTPRILLGDSLRLQQVLTNLISNAIKFTPAGGSILVSVHGHTVGHASEVDDQVELSFSVKDTGSGISPDYLPLLFQPFTQGDSSSTRKYEGTGLGLSICKRFVTMMHGDIWVESSLGKGSTFFFTVRLVQAGTVLAGRLVFPPDIRDLKALVVDDLLDSRIIIRKILISLGFRVEALSSGIEALERLQPENMLKDPVDLIMMDWKMPELDGIETSRKIREELHLTMPIIMMTAFTKDVQRSEAEAVGTNGFLPKPIFQSTLFDAIMDAFGKQGSHPPGSRMDFTTRASMYQKHLKGCQLLLAEDNLTNQQVATAILQKAGIRVTVANNGEEAVQMVQNGHFDGVLMDIQMPKMNGYEATRQIRLLPDCGQLPIIAMTAHAMKGDEEKCLEAGMDGYIAKPINQDRLFHALWRLLRAHGAADFPDMIQDDQDVEPSVANPSIVSRDLGHGNQADPEGIILAARLPKIDIPGALASSGIDGSTMQRILIGFYQDNDDTQARIRQALQAEKRETLLQLAHSLKGSAGNIGAHALKEAAGALEAACLEQQTIHSASNVFADLAKKLEDELGQVRQSLQVLLEKGVQKASIPDTTDTIEPAILLRELAKAIDQADPEEIQGVFQRMQRQSVHWDAVDPAVMRALEMQIDRYDYDQARETLAQIHQTMKEAA